MLGVITMGIAIRAYTTGYVENVRERLDYIVDFMYDNYNSLSEAKSCDLLCDLFSSEGFEINKNISGIKNSFKASYGSGDKTIAYICEYDTKPNIANICSHNFTSAMNAGAALGLKRAIGEIGGKVVVLGCPHNSKISMLDHGEFNDIDAVICGHAASKTYESGSSLGCTNLDISFKRKKILSKIEMQSIIDPQSPCILLFNLIEMFKANHSGKVIITGVIENKFSCDTLIPEEANCKISIKAFDRHFIDYTKTKLIESAKFCGKFYDCNIKYSQAQNNYMPLKTHTELSKIASHNLKECGIINIHGPVTLSEGIDLGNVSSKIPTINPGIGICKKETAFTIGEFNKTAKSDQAKENMLKAACALALTGVDVIQNPEILNAIDPENNKSLKIVN